MTAQPTAPTPRFGHALALAICVAAALLLLWPLLTGQILFGGSRSDMFIAGYSFRRFGAEWFMEHGAIPQWNPYLFGGLPYIGAMHGDIFYPSAWLRWIMPIDLAITWGMALHFVFAGFFTYRFSRALGLLWGPSVIAGVAYELGGIVASQMSPGHDGKLFVSALAPLAFWVLLHAIRNRATWAYGVFAIVCALAILGHYHMAYFLFVALGLWALYLGFWDPQRPRDGGGLTAIGMTTVGVVVGAGLSALQVLPFLEYIPFSPRAAGGSDTGWEFATSYAFPPWETFTLILPEFNGLLDNYWGQNPVKFHTEYAGFLPVALAMFACGDRTRRTLVVAMGAGFVLFMLFAFAGHTPFYRPFFESLPLLKKIRAMGMVFYLASFFLCVLAGIGAERLLARAISMRTVLAVTGVLGVFALLGAVGALQPLAEALATPDRADAVAGNAQYLRVGATRLLVVAAVGGSILCSVATGRVRRGLAVGALLAVTAVDLWSIDRKFYTFSPRAAELFSDDIVTTYLKGVAPPYRVFDAGNSYGWSLLMAYRIPIATGYHGFELQRYAELAGKYEGWRNIGAPNVLDLLAIGYVILPDTQTIPGFTQVVPRTKTAFGTTAVVYERDTMPPYARVVPSAAMVPEDQVVATITDPRFPVDGVVLVADTTALVSRVAQSPYPPSPVVASVDSWQPGAMTISLEGVDSLPSHLLVSENWYPAWRAAVDGKPAIVRRANHTLLSVDLPAGASRVTLTFDSEAYRSGKLISLVSLVTAIGMIALPFIVARNS